MSELLDNFQRVLNFDGCVNVQFTENGLGKIGTTGFVLGLMVGIHIGIVVSLTILSSLLTFSPFIWAIFVWSIYMSLLCVFHFAEFFTTAVNQPTNLAYESYIVNHSKSYTIAALASWTEYWVEYLIFGQSKLRIVVILAGVTLVLGGQILRTVAMWQCGAHFSHLIIHEKHDTHELVTSGVYSYLRHPSYFGWFYWSVGTQLILCNPVCTILYAIASWTFFKDRIPYEEQLLLSFYGDEYKQYAQRTVIGIPFVASPATAVTNENKKKK